ncbi:MAG: DUF1579 domain-containing protein [Longimicrobiales bacterium]
MSTESATTDPMHFAEPQQQHDWLQRLVGDWSYDAQMAEPGKPPDTASGTQTTRSLGRLWIVGEGQGEMPGGGTGTSLLTIGYDPPGQRFVGTWIGSMMTHLWVYDGWLDDAQRVLTLESEGPSFTGGSTLQKYRDIIEIQGDDAYVLRSQAQDDAGKWQQFMTATYRRKK